MYFLDNQHIEVMNLVITKIIKTPVLVLTSTSCCCSKLPNTLLYYNEIVDMGSGLDSFEAVKPNNECDPILVNYTSGTTGHPKRVVYSHRATYLNTLGEILRSDLREEIKVVFLWTADMFRANG